VNLAPGIDGLVHVSEIDHRPVAHPRDALSVGQAVNAVVLSVDRDRRRISLSIKDLLAAPPSTDEVQSEPVKPVPVVPVPRDPTVGDLTEGRVAGIKPYGLFVDLPAYGSRTRGLLPHEETGEKPRADLGRRFKVGDALQVEIIDVREDGKIRLSLTRAGRRTEQEEFRSFKERSAPPPGGNTAIAEAMRRALEKQQ
jgi:small subunit ribosomal protein S1